LPRCPHCDWEVRETDRFCSGDGRPLIRAHYDPVAIQEYIAGRDAYGGAFTVTNVGINPLRLRLHPSSDLVELAEHEAVIGPSEVREFAFVVNLAHAHTVREAIELESDESSPTVARIQLLISRPPQLALRVEPEVLYFGESAECRLVVSHTGGGLCTVRSAYCQEPWGSVVMAAEESLGIGDSLALALTIDSRDLPEGENSLTVGLELAGLGEQTFTVPFRLARRPNVHGTPVRLPDLLPGRVRTAETVVSNDSDQPITIAHVRSQGGDWLRVADGLKLPIRLDPGQSRPVKVEVRTHRLAGQSLVGSLVLQWDRDEAVQVPVRVRVLDPQEYEGYAGIDFGTTNSCVCVARPGDPSGEPVMVPLDFTSEGDPVQIIPTTIYFPNPDDLDEFLVGERARMMAVVPSESAFTVARIKRRLGQPEPVLVHEQPLKPEQVAARILRYLLDRAEDFTKCLIKRAVVTVPADYSTRQMKAMLEACRLAGLEDAELHRGGDLIDALENDLLDVLDEPLAAALDYIYTPQGQDLCDDRFVIFDFGGGTLDVSLIHLERGEAGAPTNFRVLAVEGREIGGEDFTDRLAAFLVERIRRERGWSDVDLPYEMDSDEFAFLRPAQQQQVRSNRQDLLRIADEVKIALSDLERVERNFQLSVGYPPRRTPVKVAVTRAELNALIRDDVAASVTLVQEALAFAGVSPGDVSRIILTGGTSQIPLVQETLASLGIPLQAAVQHKECVARGAFRMGWYRVGVSQGALRPLGLHNKTAGRYGVMVNRPGVGAEFVEVVPKGVDLPTEWYEYPGFGEPEGMLPMAQRPVFELHVVRSRSRTGPAGGGGLQAVGRIRAAVPGASPANPVGVKVQMQLDRYKVLCVRVLAGGRQVEHTFSDV
jgi:actin-like ATPase involved in cell morphogenesis